MGSYQSGQMGLTVTQLSFDFGGSNPSLPTKFQAAEPLVYKNRTFDGNLFTGKSSVLID